jgi:Kef-type K+ transport system membrane component KefB
VARRVRVARVGEEEPDGPEGRLRILTDLELAHAHVVLAIAALLVAAHAMGYVMQRLRQPRVIGEILGGVFLGPTLLGRVWPDAYTVLFSSNFNAGVIMSTITKLGLMLLLFCSGLEIRSSFSAGEKKTAAWITATGTLIPFAVALAAGPALGLGRFHGSAAPGPALDLSFNLVMAVALAVTSIPVIAKIFLDLDVIHTAFARIVLTAAVIEDVLLYVVLSIALSLVAQSDGGAHSFGLMARLGIDPGTGAAVAWHTVATVLFFAISLTAGRSIFGAVSRFRGGLVHRASPVGFLLAFLLLMTLIGTALDVNVMFGAFVAGILAGSSEGPEEPKRAIRQFSSAFFIPIYFAMVGVRLDLVRDLPILFFLAFFAAACTIKAASVYLGARLARQSSSGSVNLAVAMNARGGPGIVLASLALDHGIIDGRMYAVLVLLAILTSMMAGTWLQRELRLGRELL